MKVLIVLCAVLAYAAADVSSLEAAAPIIKSGYEIGPDGAYQYLYETGNGISAQAEGALRSSGSEYPYLVVKGAYRYSSPDGTPIELSYVADENGYQPVGSHLPVGPPIPEAIARSLQYIAANAPSVDKTPYKPASPSLYG